jgi:hypothetical protein
MNGRERLRLGQIQPPQLHVAPAGVPPASLLTEIA